MRTIPLFGACFALTLAGCVSPKHFGPTALDTAQASQTIRMALPEGESPDFIMSVGYAKTNDLRTHGGTIAVAAITNRAVYVLYWDSVESKYLPLDTLPYSEIAALSEYKSGAQRGVWLQKKGSYNVILIAVTTTGAMAQPESAMQLRKIIEERVGMAGIVSDVGRD